MSTTSSTSKQLIEAFFGEPNPIFPQDGLDAPPDVDAFKRAGEQADENVERLRELKTLLEGAIATHANSPTLATYNALQSVITQVVRKDSELFEPDLPEGIQFTDFSKKGFSHATVRRTGNQFLRARQCHDDLYGEVLRKAMSFNITDALAGNAINATGNVGVNSATQSAITALRAEVQEVRDKQLDLTRKTKSTMPKDCRLAQLMSYLSNDDPLYTTEYRNARTTAYYSHIASKGHETVTEKFNKITDRQMAEPHVSEGRLVHEDGLRLYEHFLHVESLLKTSLVTYFPDIVRHLTDPNAQPLAHDPRHITLIECICRTLGPQFLSWWTKQKFPPYHRALHDYKIFKIILILQFTPPDTDRWSKEELDRHCKSFIPAKTKFVSWYHRIQQLVEINFPAEAGWEITKAEAFQKMREGLPAYIEKEFRRLHYTHDTPEEEMRHTALTEESANDSTRKEQGHSHPDYGRVNALNRERQLRSPSRESQRSRPPNRRPTARRDGSRPPVKGSLRA